MLRTDKKILKLGFGINTLTGELGNQAMAVEIIRNSVEEPKTIQDNPMFTSLISNSLQPMATSANNTQTVLIPTTTQQILSSAQTVPSISRQALPDKIEASVIPAREIISQTNVFTSLSQLRRNYETSLSIPVYTMLDISADIANIHQKSENDLYYAINLTCTERIETITGQYKLNSKIVELLRRRHKFQNFIKEYGDAFIDSITYGRWATIIIQFHLSSIEEQNIVGGRLQGPAFLNVGAGFKVELKDLLETKTYNIYVYTAGMEYVSSGILNDVKSLSELVEKIKIEGQKTDAIQISWTFQPYVVACEDQIRAKGIRLEQLMLTARTLSRYINDCQEMVKRYFQELYIVDMEWVEEDWFLYQFGPRNEIAVALKAMEITLVYLGHYVRKSACNGLLLEDLADQIKWVIDKIEDLGRALPDKDYVPVICIPDTEIRCLKENHKARQFEFDINPPDGVTFLTFMIKTQAEQIEQAKRTAIILTEHMLKSIAEMIEKLYDKLLNKKRRVGAEVRFYVSQALVWSEQIKRTMEKLKDEKDYLIPKFYISTYNAFNFKDFLELALEARDLARGIAGTACADKITLSKHGSVFLKGNLDRIDALRNRLLKISEPISRNTTASVPSTGDGNTETSASSTGGDITATFTDLGVGTQTTATFSNMATQTRTACTGFALTPTEEILLKRLKIIMAEELLEKITVLIEEIKPKVENKDSKLARPPYSLLKLKQHTICKNNFFSNYILRKGKFRLKSSTIISDIHDGKELPVGRTLSKVYLKPYGDGCLKKYAEFQMKDDNSKYKVGVFAHCYFKRPINKLPRTTDVRETVLNLYR